MPDKTNISQFLVWTWRRLPGWVKRQAPPRWVLSPIAESLPTRLRVEQDLFDKPQYAYGIYWAAMQAKALSLPEMSTIEFGVGSGRGLVAMESIARQIAREVGVNIKIYGFDLGSGLPAPQDYRDLPYVWREGSFQMDEQQLRAQLHEAELVLGDVRDTVHSFLRRKGVPPIGFVAFDLDFYSSTKAALDSLKSEDYGRYLPRILMYFDSIIARADWKYYCEYVSAPSAIHEFNSECESRKICRITGLSYRRRYPSLWNEMMYVCHQFSHPLYCKYIGEQIRKGF